jgi:hypothetical protein
MYHTVPPPVNSTNSQQNKEETDKDEKLFVNKVGSDRWEKLRLLREKKEVLKNKLEHTANRIDNEKTKTKKRSADTAKQKQPRGTSALENDIKLTLAKAIEQDRKFNGVPEKVFNIYKRTNRFKRTIFYISFLCRA